VIQLRLWLLFILGIIVDDPDPIPGLFHCLLGG
jgi:hypothetical protein